MEDPNKYNVSILNHNQENWQDYHWKARQINQPDPRDRRVEFGYSNGDGLPC